MSDLVRWPVAGNRSQPLPKSRILPISGTPDTPVTAAEAVGRVRVRATADATVITIAPEVIPLRPVIAQNRDKPVANQGAVPRAVTSRVVGGLAVAEVVFGQAAGYVKVRATADASVIAGAAPTPLLPIRAPYKANQPATARLASRLTLVSAVIEAAAVGRVRVRATASGDAIPQAMRPARASSANQPQAARLRSRIPVATFPIAGLVTAQATGLIRVRATAAASVIVQATAQGRVRVTSTAAGVAISPAYAPLRSKANQPQRARLLSRIQDVRPPAGVTFADPTVGRVRIRATAASSVIEVAVAQGRVRVRSTADGAAISPAMRPLRAEVPNQPQAARLRSRIPVATFPIAGLVTAQATGRIRVRGTASAFVTTSAQARGRVRIRSIVVGTRILSGQASGRVRVRSRATGLDLVIVSARGRIRVRSSVASRVIVTAAARGRIRVRAQAIALKFITSSARGRVRIRSTAASDVFGQNFVFGSARGRIRLRSMVLASVHDANPRWPQGTDGDRWPQGTDGDRWPQSTTSNRW